MRRFAFLLLVFSGIAYADEDPLTVAVASNFLATAKKVAQRYTDDHGIEVLLVSGSTGKLYAQIVNGAPYDVYLAADEERPRLLEEAGLTIQGQRVTYAYGVLSLFTTDSRFAGRCEEGLQNGDFGRLAIANPDVAPFGRAARQYLQQQGLWKRYASRIVMGQNVAQTTQFVATGNADAGVGWPGDAPLSCRVSLPPGMYDPIPQQAVALSRSDIPDAATAFIASFEDERIVELIADDGYRTSTQ